MSEKPAAPVEAMRLAVAALALEVHEAVHDDVVARWRAVEAEHEQLRGLLIAWESRVVCPQCGQRYTERACGPTHAVVHALVHPSHFGSKTPGP